MSCAIPRVAPASRPKSPFPRLLAALAMGWLTVAPATAQEAVTNGDFDNGLSGWQVTVFGNEFQPAYTAPADVDGPGPLPSTNAFHTQAFGLGPPGLTAGVVRLSQDVSLMAGQTYALTANVAGLSPSILETDRGTIQVRVGNQHLDAIVFSNPSLWNYGSLSALFEVPASGDIELTFDVVREGPFGDLSPFQLIDDVSLVPTGATAPALPSAGPAVPNGDLFVSSSGTNSVLRFDGSTGAFVATAASGGGLNGPRGFTLAPSGALLVCSFGTDEIIAFDPSTGMNLGVFVNETVNDPEASALGPNGNLFVSTNGGAVVEINAITGNPQGVFVPGLASPRGLTFGPDGNLYVADEAADAVLRFDYPTASPEEPFASGAAFVSPKGLIFGPDGHLYVTCELGTERVLRFHGVTGAFLGVAAVGALGRAEGLTFTPTGTLLVNDGLKDQVVEFGPDTALSAGTFVSSGLAQPSLGLSFLDLYASPWGNLGNGLAGTLGVPLLVGSGTLVDGESTTLLLTQALPSGSSYLVLGLTDSSTPFKGGVLVPSPDVVFNGIPIDRGGSLSLSFPWPSGLPAGQDTYWQHWIPDPAGPAGFAASNAISGTTP